MNSPDLLFLGGQPSFMMPMAPQRLYDSRVSLPSQIAAGSSVLINPASTIVPDAATAIAVNIALVQPVGAGDVNVWASTGVSGSDVAAHTAGDTATSTFATVPIDAGGFRVGVSGSKMDVVVDIVGFYMPSDVGVKAGRTIALSPVRAYDSRVTGGIFAAGERRVITMPSSVPAGSSMVVGSVAALGAPAASYVSVLSTVDDPGGVPVTSTVNVGVGQVRANQFEVKLNSSRQLTVYSKSGGHVVIDVQGYVTDATAATSEAGLFVRLDTGRQLINQNMSAGQTVVSSVGSIPVVPSDAAGVTEAVRFAPSANGYLTIWPSNVAQPSTSNVNGLTGEVLSAHATPKVGAGQVSTYSLAAANVKVWVTGYYTSILHPLNPPVPYEPATLTWDTEQRLASSTSSTGGVSSYAYDASGIRIAQWLPDGSMTLYFGDIETTRNSAGTWTQTRRSYMFGGAVVGSRSYTSSGNTISWLLTDRQGSITTTITAGVAATRYYQPYGGRRGPDPATEPTSTGFLGQHEDTTTLTYLNNRYHDPTLGTFISVDPLVASTGEAYVYGSGNPVTWSDPGGLCTGRTCNAEDNQAVRDAQRDHFAGVEASALEAESRGHGGDVQAQGFFIARVLDAYHDAVGISIATGSGASFEIGCAIPGGLPDLCRPGLSPKVVGELKYDTPWGEREGQRQLAGYEASGAKVNRGEFGSSGSTMAGVIRLNWRESSTAGLYLYRVDNWSVAQLLAGMAATYEANRAAQNASRSGGPSAAATVPVLANSSGGWSSALPSLSIPRIEPSISLGSAFLMIGMMGMGGAMILHGH